MECFRSEATDGLSSLMRKVSGGPRANVANDSASASANETSVVGKADGNVSGAILKGFILADDASRLLGVTGLGSG